MVAVIIVMIPIVILTLIFGFVKVGIKRVIPGIEIIFWPLVFLGWVGWLYSFFDFNNGFDNYFDGAEWWQIALGFFIFSLVYWGAVFFVKTLTQPIDCFDGIYKDIRKEEKEKRYEEHRKVEAKKDEDPELAALLQRLGQ